MGQLLVLIAISALVWWQLNRWLTDPGLNSRVIHHRSRIDRFWERSDQNMRTGQIVEAERCLLSILRIDDKNAPAYNRLGILYAKQKEYINAIRCFEIARTIQPGAASIHNLGVVYYDTGNYEKASLAFKQAIDLDNSSAFRHLVYAKALEQLDRTKEVTTALEKSLDLDPNREIYQILLKHYDRHGLEEKAAAIRQELNRLIHLGRPERLKRPQRIVIT